MSGGGGGTLAKGWGVHYCCGGAVGGLYSSLKVFNLFSQSWSLSLSDRESSCGGGEGGVGVNHRTSNKPSGPYLICFGSQTF